MTTPDTLNELAERDRFVPAPWPRDGRINLSAAVRELADPAIAAFRRALAAKETK